MEQTGNAKRGPADYRTGCGLQKPGGCLPEKTGSARSAGRHERKQERRAAARSGLAVR